MTVKKTYITTTIPYVNAEPHVGFALELVQADVLARYTRLFDEGPVRFQTGTDENAFKNVLSARQRGVPTDQFVAANSRAFRELAEALGSSHDDFVQTTDLRHRHAVHQLWERLTSGDVYEASYRGLYCNGCEDFLLERDLANGLCPEHRTPVEPVEERNHFFRLSAYQNVLERLVAGDVIRVTPRVRKNEVLSFIRQGLQDISISRNAKRSGGWGISVPGDPTKVVYVWIDALVNYLSGPANGGNIADAPFWDAETRKIHVIGKNVWKFHAVYWPALLLSAGLPLPDEIVVHGFVTVNGRKISKTAREGDDEGNADEKVKSPREYIHTFGADAVRYYLLRAIPPFRDGDFSERELATVYTADLANGFGNLCTRLTTLCERAHLNIQTGTAGSASPPIGLKEAANAFRLDEVLTILWREIACLNQEIADRKPWEAFKHGAVADIRPDLISWATRLRYLAHWLSPVLPVATRTVLDCLEGNPVRKCPALFPKLRC